MGYQNDLLVQCMRGQKPYTVRFLVPASIPALLHAPRLIERPSDEDIVAATLDEIHKLGRLLAIQERAAQSGASGPNLSVGVDALNRISEWPIAAAWDGYFPDPSLT